MEGAMEHVINWKDIFTGRLSEAGFSEDEITTIYTVEMDLREFFEFDGMMPGCLRLQNIERGGSSIIYYWESESNEAVCPHCNAKSSRETHDFYDRRVQDIPQWGMTVYHVIRCKRYFCHSEDCGKDRFVERFFEFADESAWVTRRFKEFCIERSLGCGCNRAEREIRAEGGVVSDDTIGRYLKAKATGVIEINMARDNVKVLSVDDINLRKGDKSSGCTVFIDAEAHKVLIIVRGTTKEATKRVMELFKSAEFLSSDRASAYTSAGSEEEKVQVADRFHLFQNAQKAVKDALAAGIPATVLVRDGDGWVMVAKADSSNGDTYYTVPEETTEERIKFAELTPAKAEKYRGTLKLIELADKGMHTADIAKEMGIPYNKVQQLRRSAANTIRDVNERISSKIAKINEQEAIEESGLELPGANSEKTVAGDRVKPARESIVEPFRETVVEMWKAGGNHRTIYPELQSQGYTGSANAIYQYILQLGKEMPEEIARERKPKAEKKLDEGFDPAQAKELPELSLDSVARDSIYKAVLKEARLSRTTEKEAESKEEADQERPKDEEPKAKGSRPASSSSSPFSAKVLDLIYGPEDDTEKQEKKTVDVKKNCT